MIKRDYRKFFTYPETAYFMAGMVDLKPGEFVLEPSAGNGALVKAIKAKCQEVKVIAIEIDPQWESELRKFADIVVIKDFLQVPVLAKFNHCLANPPFGNGTNLQAHFDLICNHVKTGGKIVMIVPADFTPNIIHETHPLENWSKNSDGSMTEIKIIEFFNP